MVKVTAADGHELEAYSAEPEGRARGGVVVVQEIFGVTGHIKRVAEQYAAEGFKVIAPAMFDRIEPGITLDYKEIQQGIAYMRQLDWAGTLADVEAAAEYVRGAGGGTAVVGFCWGGTVAHVAASELDFDAAVSYYGGGVAKMLDKEPQCAIVYHIGDQDHSIPLADIDKIKEAYPAATVYVYEGAQHGFNCDERASYSAADAKSAFARSVELLREETS
ncbi:MAG TPA: dienelactone hydrolase family protein [Gammaproteobacteria bacterium]|nr:dienelactone hydrolase family protein [Gammaproteobacteria bacterium]